MTIDVVRSLCRNRTSNFDAWNEIRRNCLSRCVMWLLFLRRRIFILDFSYWTAMSVANSRSSSTVENASERSPAWQYEVLTLTFNQDCTLVYFYPPIVLLCDEILVLFVGRWLWVPWIPTHYSPSIKRIDWMKFMIVVSSSQPIEFALAITIWFLSYSLPSQPVDTYCIGTSSSSDSRCLAHRFASTVNPHRTTNPTLNCFHSI